MVCAVLLGDDMNKVKWHRGEDGEPTLLVDEGKGFVTYSKSILYKPDIAGFSEGITTFRACVKAGYQIIDINGNLIS